MPCQSATLAVVSYWSSKTVVRDEYGVLNKPVDSMGAVALPAWQLNETKTTALDKAQEAV